GMASSRKRGHRSGVSPSTGTAVTAAPSTTPSSATSRACTARRLPRSCCAGVLQEGRSVIPKSTKPTRIAENIDVFDFELTAAEMAAIDRLDTGHRGGPEPDAITLESFGREIAEA